MESVIQLNELCWYLSGYLDSKSLYDFIFSCKRIYGLLFNKTFFKEYAMSLSESNMNEQYGYFLDMYVSYLTPKQVMNIDGQKITRYALQYITETEENKINLRIAKVVADISNHKYYTLLNLNECTKQWCKTSSQVQHFELAKEYIHLFIMATGLVFMHNRADKIDEEFIEKYKYGQLTTKQQMLQDAWYEQHSSVESLLSLDYMDLHRLNKQYLIDIFTNEFDKYDMIYIIDPRDVGRHILLPDMFFTSLLNSLKKRNLEFEHKTGFLEKVKKLLNKDLSIQHRLKLSLRDDNQLDTLRQFLIETQINNNYLYLGLAYGGTSFTEDALKRFYNSLHEFNVDKIYIDKLYHCMFQHELDKNVWIDKINKYYK